MCTLSYFILPLILNHKKFLRFDLVFNFVFSRVLVFVGFISFRHFFYVYLLFFPRFICMFFFLYFCYFSKFPSIMSFLSVVYCVLVLRFHPFGIKPPVELARGCKRTTIMRWGRGYIKCNKIMRTYTWCWVDRNYEATSSVTKLWGPFSLKRGTQSLKRLSKCH